MPPAPRIALYPKGESKTVSRQRPQLFKSTQRLFVHRNRSLYSHLGYNRNSSHIVTAVTIATAPIP